MQARASVTAIAVAMAFTRASRKMLEHNPCDVEFEHEVKKAIALGEYLWTAGRQKLTTFNWALTGVVSSLPYGYQARFFEKVVVPGYDDIIFYRKNMLNEQIQYAIAKGIKQIVFLGAGYDARPMLIAEKYPHLKVFEVDMGLTRETKLQALCNLPQDMNFGRFFVDGFSPIGVEGDVSYRHHHARFESGGDVRFVQCDLGRDDLIDDLTFCGYDKKENVLVIGEGLSTYLSEDENLKLMVKVQELLISDKSVFLYSFMSASRKSISVTESVAVREANENYQFALAPQAILDFAAKAGLVVSGMFDATNHLLHGGDEASHDFYRNGYPREVYYSLKKTNKPCLNKSIDEVPKIIFEGPEEMGWKYSVCGC